jgi:hypothetical protein
MTFHPWVMTLNPWVRVRVRVRVRTKHPSVLTKTFGGTRTSIFLSEGYDFSSLGYDTSSLGYDIPGLGV